MLLLIYFRGRRADFLDDRGDDGRYQKKLRLLYMSTRSVCVCVCVKLISACSHHHPSSFPPSLGLCFYLDGPFPKTPRTYPSRCSWRV